MDRRALFELIARRQSHKGHWRREADRLTLEGEVAAELHTRALRREVARRIRLFRRGLRRVVSRPDLLGGEPAFQGTRVSVRHVGQLVRKGVPESELLEDYPMLGREDLEFARLFEAQLNRLGG